MHGEIHCKLSKNNCVTSFHTRKKRLSAKMLMSRVGQRYSNTFLLTGSLYLPLFWLCSEQLYVMEVSENPSA